MTAFVDNLKEHYTELQLMDATSQVRLVAKINEVTNALKLAGVASPSLTGFPTGTVLSTAQAGTGDSTNKWDYGDMGQFGNNIRTEPLLVRIAATAGATPTCTYAIQGSVDDSTYANLTFADSGTPTVFGSSTFTLTSTTTAVKIIKPNQVFRYLKVVYSVNTNVTNTTDVYRLG